MERVRNFIFLGSKIAIDGDCRHEIKRCLLIGRKAMTILGSILKSRDTALPAKVHLVKAMVLPVVGYECESWTIKKASSVQSLSRVRLCDSMNRSTPGLPVHHHLPEFTQTQVHRVRDAIQPSHPRLSPSPPAPNPSQHQSLFQNESTLRMRWPKYWSFSSSIIPSKEIPGLISFRMDWLDLLEVQGTLKSLH